MAIRVAKIAWCLEIDGACYANRDEICYVLVVSQFQDTEELLLVSVSWLCCKSFFEVLWSFPNSFEVQEKVQAWCIVLPEPEHCGEFMRSNSSAESWQKLTRIVSTNTGLYICIQCLSQTSNAFRGFTFAGGPKKPLQGVQPWPGRFGVSVLYPLLLQLNQYHQLTSIFLSPGRKLFPDQWSFIAFLTLLYWFAYGVELIFFSGFYVVFAFYLSFSCTYQVCLFLLWLKNAFFVDMWLCVW